MPRLLKRCLLVAVALLGIPGCGRSVPHGELGNVVYRIPDVPGIDQPYELPELEGMQPLDEAAAGMAR